MFSAKPAPLTPRSPGPLCQPPCLAPRTLPVLFCLWLVSPDLSPVARMCPGSVSQQLGHVLSKWMLIPGPSPRMEILEPWGGVVEMQRASSLGSDDGSQNPGSDCDRPFNLSEPQSPPLPAS